MNGQDNKPSQAEGEDPERPDEHEVLPQKGHPSQAEGDDVGSEDGES
ncbi:hypothetical protein [Ruicaihuangia caeni]